MLTEPVFNTDSGETFLGRIIGWCCACYEAYYTSWLRCNSAYVDPFFVVSGVTPSTRATNCCLVCWYAALLLLIRQRQQDGMAGGPDIRAKHPHLTFACESAPRCSLRRRSLSLSALLLVVAAYACNRLRALLVQLCMCTPRLAT